jgi:hypothetical protein
MVKNNSIYIDIYIYIYLHSTGLHDYDEFIHFHPFKLSSSKSCLGLLGSIPIVIDSMGLLGSIPTQCLNGPIGINP